MLLVTGGAGFIGSNFVLSTIAQTGEPVVNLDKLTYAGSLRNLDSLAGDARHVFVRGDICDRKLVRELLAAHRPRAIVHFAAESHVDRSIEGPAEFMQTNVIGTFCMLEEARAHWQGLGGAERDRARAVARLVGAHRLDYGARAPVGRRQHVEVTRQVLLDLALGLSEEGEIPAVAERAGDGADRERARVPKRIEEARPAAELADPLGAPGEVVLLLARRLLERSARARVPRRERLALVERLRTDFAHMVDAHQRGRVLPLAGAELGLGHALGGRAPRRLGHAGDRPQRAVELADQSVDGKHLARLTEKKRAPEGARLDLPDVSLRSDASC